MAHSTKQTNPPRSLPHHIGPSRVTGAKRSPEVIALGLAPGWKDSLCVVEPELECVQRHHVCTHVPAQILQYHTQSTW